MPALTTLPRAETSFYHLQGQMPAFLVTSVANTIVKRRIREIAQGFIELSIAEVQRSLAGKSSRPRVSSSA